MASNVRGRRWAVMAVALVAASFAAALLGWRWTVVRRHREARAAIDRGRAFLQRGHPVMALRAVDLIPGDGQEGAEALTVKGLALAALDQPEAARRALERSLALMPDQPMALKVLAATYLNASDVERGLASLRAAARLDPTDFRPWFAIGDVYDQLGRASEASNAYREALRRKPEDAECRLRLASALTAANADDEATPLLERLRTERPDNAAVAALSARNAQARGQLEESHRFVDQALALDPNHVDALVLRSQLRQRDGRRDLALADAEQAAALDLTNTAALNQLSLAEAALGLKERSAATAARRHRVLGQRARMHQVTEEIRARPDDPEPRWRLGQLAAESGATPLAIRSYRAALFLDPQCQPALQGLASLGVGGRGMGVGSP